MSITQVLSARSQHQPVHHAKFKELIKEVGSMKRWSLISRQLLDPEGSDHVRDICVEMVNALVQHLYACFKLCWYLMV